MYWTVKYAFMTKTEKSLRFRLPFIRISRRSRSFYNIFGFDYKAGTGRFSRRPAKPRRSFSGFATA